MPTKKKPTKKKPQPYRSVANPKLKARYRFVLYKRGENLRHLIWSPSLGVIGWSSEPQTPVSAGRANTHADDIREQAKELLGRGWKVREIEILPDGTESTPY